MLRSALIARHRSLQLAARHVTRPVPKGPFSTATAKVSVQDVATLRKQTGLAIARCKEALLQSQGQVPEALAWLAKHDKAFSEGRAAKLGARATTQGLTSFSIAREEGPWTAALVELNCETDFVAKNDLFQDLAKNYALLSRQHVVSSAAYTQPTMALAPIEAATMGEIPALKEALVRTVARVGENIQLGRATGLSLDRGYVAGYAHHAVAGGQTGSTAAVVAIRSAQEGHVAFQAFARKLAQHIVGFRPACLDAQDAVAMSLDPVAEKDMLIHQPYLFDGSKTVAQAVEAISQEHGITVDEIKYIYI